MKVGVDKRNLITTIWTLILILHLIACLWGAAGYFDTSSNENWRFNDNLQDADAATIYITSLYFSAVVTLTVGYGDIVASNNWERFFCILIFLIGTAMFSYTLSAIGKILILSILG